MLLGIYWSASFDLNVEQALRADANFRYRRIP